jgi:hypothetical protein
MLAALNRSLGKERAIDTRQDLDRSVNRRPKREMGAIMPLHHARILHRHDCASVRSESPINIERLRHGIGEVFPRAAAVLLTMTRVKP